MQNNPQPYEVYRHFKGNMYQVLCIAKDSENGQKMVVYQRLDAVNEVYVRPYDMFIGPVDNVKYPDAGQYYRFELVEQGKTEPQNAGAKLCEADTQNASTETCEADAQNASTVNPLLISFLDAETYSRKLEILSAMQSQITHEMINAIAASLEIEVNEEDIEDRYEAVRNCLLTLERFECNRLR